MLALIGFIVLVCLGIYLVRCGVLVRFLTFWLWKIRISASLGSGCAGILVGFSLCTFHCAFYGLISI
jgi:hypothetical protein